MLIQRTNIKTANTPRIEAAEVKTSSNPPTEKSEPAWLDRMVKDVPVEQNNVISVVTGTTTGVAAGIGIGLLCNQLPLGAVIGAVAGVAGGLVGGALFNRKALEQRDLAKSRILGQQEFQKARFQRSLQLPTEPTATFSKAKVYESGKNFMLEFPADGSLMTVTNSGPKRAQAWAMRESEAYGIGGEVLEKLNRGIEETEAVIWQPRNNKAYQPSFSDVKRHKPLGAKDLQAQLSDDGKLNLSHSGSPDDGVTYDLTTGDVSSPYLQLQGGEVKDLNLNIPKSPDRNETPYVGYRFSDGTFEQLGGSHRTLSTSLPLTSLGVDEVSFPKTQGVNERQDRTLLSLQNEGVFRSVQ